MDYTKLGELLKSGRNKKGYTQYTVAALLGYTPQNISSWERGKSKMDIDTYIRLCNLYDMDFVYTVMDCTEKIGLPHFPVECDADDNRLDGYHPLTSDEQQLLAYFRQLNPQGMEYILQTAQMASQVYIKSSSLPKLEPKKA